VSVTLDSSMSKEIVESVLLTQSTTKHSLNAIVLRDTHSIVVHAFLLLLLQLNTSFQLSLQNAKILMPTSFLEPDVSAILATI
jgi:hypothetical protein